MISLLKSILKGFMYVFFLPIGICFICVYMAFGLVVFIYRFGKINFLFFTGRDLNTELKEDIEIKKILEANAPKEDNNSNLNLYPSDSEMYNTNYVSPTFENMNNNIENEASQENKGGE